MNWRHRKRKVAVHFWPQELWIGYQVGKKAYYLCLIPSVVIVINRRRKGDQDNGGKSSTEN